MARGGMTVADYWADKIGRAKAAVPSMAFPVFAEKPVDTDLREGILTVHNHPKRLAESNCRGIRSAFFSVPLLAGGEGEGFGDDQMIRLVLGERA